VCLWFITLDLSHRCFYIDFTKYYVLRIAVCSFKSCLLLKALPWGLFLKINLVVPQFFFHQVAISCFLSVVTLFFAQLLNYKFWITCQIDSGHIKVPPDRFRCPKLWYQIHNSFEKFLFRVLHNQTAGKTISSTGTSFYFMGTNISV